MKRVTISIRCKEGGKARFTYTDHEWMVYKDGRIVSADADGHSAAMDAEIVGIIPHETLSALEKVLYFPEKMYRSMRCKSLT